VLIVKIEHRPEVSRHRLDAVAYVHGTLGERLFVGVGHNRTILAFVVLTGFQDGSITESEPIISVDRSLHISLLCRLSQELRKAVHSY
jgi:hypothetical protein